MSESYGSIEIDGKEYDIENIFPHIKVPDCWVDDSNKTGTANGERKLYLPNSPVGDTTVFFNDFQNCVGLVRKKDLLDALKDSRQEYTTPTLNYRESDRLAELYDQRLNRIRQQPDEVMYFPIYKAEVGHAGVYIKTDRRNRRRESRENIWNPFDLLRQISFADLSYLAIMKLRDADGKNYFYFRPFIDSSNKVYSDAQIKRIEQQPDISEEKKESLIQSRQGQGKYRQQLLEECLFCPITRVTEERMLIASHIKPWTDSNDFEKTDPKNGLLLTPTYDRLFDQGFISFNDDKTMMVSPWISKVNQSRLDIRNGKKVDLLPIEGREGYLAYHREHVFKA